jgi:hypothetical protein
MEKSMTSVMVVEIAGGGHHCYSSMSVALTIWTLMPPFFTTSAYVFFVGVLFGRGWWEFFHRPPFFVVGGLSLISVAHCLPATSLLFILCVVTACYLQVYDL